MKKIRKKIIFIELFFVVIVLFIIYDLSFCSGTITGCIFHRNSVEKAKQYCELVILEIERYKEVNGIYPDDLDAISVNSQLPWLLKNTQLYKEEKHKIFYMIHKDGKGYSLWFEDPRKFSYFYEYDHIKKIWWEHT